MEHHNITSGMGKRRKPDISKDDLAAGHGILEQTQTLAGVIAKVRRELPEGIIDITSDTYQYEPPSITVVSRDNQALYPFLDSLADELAATGLALGSHIAGSFDDDVQYDRWGIVPSAPAN